MLRYYVSDRRGSDSTGNGSAANPWKTIGKAIMNSPTVPGVSLGTDGAVLYVEPGVYRESALLQLTPTESAPLEIVADSDGAGFLAGGYATPATGVVEWRAWSDRFTPINLSCLRASTGTSHVTLRGFKMIGGTGSGTCVQINAGKAWRIADTNFVSLLSNMPLSFQDMPVGGYGSVVERCCFHLAYAARGIRAQVPETASEYSIGLTVRDCVFIGGAEGIRLERIANTGLGKLGTGVAIQHCAFLGQSAAISVYTGVTIALTVPIAVRGCYIAGQLTAGHLSHVDEDWNGFVTVASRVNVAAGVNSASSLIPAFDFMDGLLVGTPLRPIGTPTAGSPWLGFVGGSGFTSTTDRAGRARPEGGLATNPALGALERHDTGEPDVDHADAESTACLKLVGPASSEHLVPVDAKSTTIKVKVRWDGDHGDAKKPRAILLANPEIGVAADQTITATSTGGTGSTPNAYETLTFAAFTPTKAGAVMLRLVSRSATGTGAAYFDSITL